MSNTEHPEEDQEVAMPFAAFLQGFPETHDRATKLLAELTKLTQGHGRAGTLTIKLTMSPRVVGAERVAEVKLDVSSKPPTMPAEAGNLYVTNAANLSRTPVAQQALPLRDVSKPRGEDIPPNTQQEAK